MTTTKTPPPDRPASGLAKRVSDLKPLLGVLLVLVYLVVRTAYVRFYRPFGLSPDDLGLGYLDLLAQSAIGTVALPLIALLLVSTVTLLPLAGVELGKLAPRKLFPALLGVILLILVSQVHEPFARWIFVLGVLAVMIVAIGGLPRHLESRQKLLGKPESFWWRCALAALTSVVLAVSGQQLIVHAEREAQLVERGIPAHFTELGVRLTSWGAEAATLSWTTARPVLRYARSPTPA